LDADSPVQGVKIARRNTTLVALVSVLLAMNMPDYGRNITYGIVVLPLLLLYGREEKEE